MQVILSPRSSPDNVASPPLAESPPARLISHRSKVGPNFGAINRTFATGPHMLQTFSGGNFAPAPCEDGLNSA